MFTEYFTSYELLYASVDSIEYGIKINIPNSVLATTYSDESLDLLPNPAKGKITTKDIEKLQGSTFIIINTLGVESAVGNITADFIDIFELHSGLYVLLISNGKVSYRATFMKE